MDGNKLNKQNYNRVYYLDILRIIATFAVVVIHVSGSKWHSLEPSSFNWQIFNFYNSISRFAVPVFVMISGALFLNREYTVKSIFKKNILRIVTAFCFWSVVYGVLAVLLYKRSIKIAVGEMIVGHYHMWFLFMIVGLYIACPILKKITESKKLTTYFLTTAFVFSFVIPMCTNIVSLFTQSIADTLDVIIGNVNYKIAVGYSGYFVLGYVLFNKTFSNKEKKIIYTLGALGFVSTVALTAFASDFKGETIDIFDDYFAVNVLLEAVGLFVFFKNLKLNLSDKAGKLLGSLSKYSFGVYLVHLVILETATQLSDINVITFNPIISVPVLSVIITVASFAFSAILNKIPLLKKYIV